jgi:hypothetical protein
VSGDQCTLEPEHSGDHHDAVRDWSWYRIGSVSSRYKGKPVPLRRSVPAPHVKARKAAKARAIVAKARQTAETTIMGAPPGSPRTLAYLRNMATGSGSAWYIEVAATKRVVWAGLKGQSAATWARNNGYRLERAPDQTEMPALSADSDCITVPACGSMESDSNTRSTKCAE